MEWAHQVRKLFQVFKPGYIFQIWPGLIQFFLKFSIDCWIVDDANRPVDERVPCCICPGIDKEHSFIPELLVGKGVNFVL